MAIFIGQTNQLILKNCNKSKRAVYHVVCIDERILNHFSKSSYDLFSTFPTKSLQFTPTTLDPEKLPESLYWTSYTIWPYFLKSKKKNRIFDHQNRCKKIFLAEFSGRCGPATKAIPGINTPHTRPQTPIMLMYEPQPFLPICILKNWLSNAKRHFFGENVVFVAFWVLLLLFFKISWTRRCC